MPVKRIKQPEAESPQHREGNWVGWAPGFPGPDVWKWLDDDDVAKSSEYMDVVADMIIQHGQMLVKHGQAMKRLARLRGQSKGASAADDTSEQE